MNFPSEECGLTRCSLQADNICVIKRCRGADERASRSDRWIHFRVAYKRELGVRESCRPSTSLTPFVFVCRRVGLC